MEEKKYYAEEELLDMVESGKESWLFFVTHHSPTLEEEFEKFCRSEHLERTSESAQAFLDYREGLSEIALQEGLM